MNNIRLVINFVLRIASSTVLNFPPFQFTVLEFFISVTVLGLLFSFVRKLID